MGCNIFRDMQVTTPSPAYILIYDIECSEEGCLLPATLRWETEYIGTSSDGEKLSEAGSISAVSRCSNE